MFVEKAVKNLMVLSDFFSPEIQLLTLLHRSIVVNSYMVIHILYRMKPLKENGYDLDFVVSVSTTNGALR